MHFGPPAEIFGVDGIIILVVVVLVLFGSTQIPKLARSLGSAQKEFKKGLDEGSSRGRQGRRRGGPGHPAGRRRTRPRRPRPRPGQRRRASRARRPRDRGTGATPMSEAARTGAGSGGRRTGRRRWIPFWVLQARAGRGLRPRGRLGPRVQQRGCWSPRPCAFAAWPSPPTVRSGSSGSAALRSISTLLMAVAVARGPVAGRPRAAAGHRGDHRPRVRRRRA